MTVVVATAGWSIPRAAADAFARDGSHLERYARVLPGVEIDSSFSRPHRVATYARWAAATPAGFRFAVKLPKAITHVARLRDCEPALDAFVGPVHGLGDKLDVLLVQLPPSLVFEPSVVDAFLSALHARHDGAVVVEPRHASWFTAAADACLGDRRVARVAADPASHPDAARPGGWTGAGATIYFRWHGSPRMYWSAYDDDWLARRAEDVMRWMPDRTVWCVFDNTAAGAAIDDALRFRTRVAAA